MRPLPWRMRRPFAPGTTPWRSLKDAWGLSDAAARLCWLRGLETPEDLAWRLDPSWHRTHDPGLLSGMAEACTRIRRAVSEQEQIVVYGDYDVDGVTATALLVRVLEKLGARVRFFIPDRFNDGYGLHLDCLETLAKEGAQLIVTVDCGVRSVAEVEAGRAQGLGFVVTDHHTPGPVLPAAEAVVHPALGSYPNPHLAGVGVAFKLAQALLDAVPVPTEADVPFLDGLLKLVALGTVADMVPLQGENALLVRRGLHALEGGLGPGLAALFQEARLQAPYRAQDLAFGPVPRLNAAGRMHGADDAVHLLLCRDPQEARRLAQLVSMHNEARRECQRQVAAVLPPPDGSPFDLVVHPEAHKGVMGIVAAQRMRRTGLPTGVGTVVEDRVHCSLRAPDGYDCTALLEAAEPFLSSGGGHRAAGGMSFPLNRLAFVRKALNTAAEGQARLRTPSAVLVDGEGRGMVPPWEELLRLEPFGQGFPEPAMLLEGQLQGEGRFFGQGHARFQLAPDGTEVVWFFAEPEGLPAAGSALACAAAPADHPRFGRSWRLEAFVGEAAC